jgi:hypothetical protein
LVEPHRLPVAAQRLRVSLAAWDARLFVPD